MDSRTREGLKLRAGILKAMAHPTRLFLAEELADGPRCVCELTDMVGADISTVSRHLSVLRNAGYDTGLFGKWHLGSAPEYGPNEYGFNHSYGSLAGGVDPYNHHYKRGEFSFTWHRNGNRMEETGHVTDLIAREAVEWIEDREAPWFCYVPFTAVHVPVKPVQKWLDRYAGEHFDGDPDRDWSYKKYAAYTSHMDRAVGKLLESLSRTCQRENTIVVFASDNWAINDCPIHGTDKYPGWQVAYPRLGSNEPFRGVKGQLYEGGIRTPTIVNWRGTLEAGRMDHPVQVVDWMPTFTALAGADVEEDPAWDGRDVWPLIDGSREVPEERPLFWNFSGGSRLGMRRGPWKLIRRRTDQTWEEELYNIDEDPYEENEASETNPGIASELRDLIEGERELDYVSKRDDVEGPRMP